MSIYTSSGTENVFLRCHCCVVIKFMQLEVILTGNTFPVIGALMYIHMHAVKHSKAVYSIHMCAHCKMTYFRRN